MKQEKPEKVIIFDTTLRDGEQSPGASLTPSEKLLIARQLKRLNVDVIEAGFPVISKGDFKAVNMIAKEIEGPIITALARCIKLDIDKAIEALKPAKRKRIHIFIATSETHLKYKLKMNQDEVIEKAVNAIQYAKQFIEDIEFSAEDAARTDRDYLTKVIEACIDAGATTINIPDTVGYTTPDEFFNLVKYLKENVKNIDQAVLSVHCHNDLGMAVANSLSAVQAGARQVECALNGIGERAGNCALEEIVMALNVREDVYKVTNQVKPKELIKTSQLVEELTGLSVQPNKAIVGINAFAHEAGIHQHGLLSNAGTYEIIDPKSIGLDSYQLVIGKHSGRAALKLWLDQKNIEFDDTEIDLLSERIKCLADDKKRLKDSDILDMIEHHQNNATII